MMPFGCSGCGHDNVKLFMVELIWCMMGTMDGAGGRKKERKRMTHKVSQPQNGGISCLVRLSPAQ
jgi:hypothetical protein